MAGHKEGSGIGAPVRRLEDRRFLTGQGRYTDDVVLAGMAHAHIVRSPHAHARIARIDIAAAQAAPGVLAVLTGEDARKAGLRPLPCRIPPPVAPGAASFVPLQPVLATGKVVHVGDRVAAVIAGSASQARDAAERVQVDYEPLPAVTLENALGEGAAAVHDGHPSNLSFVLEKGDRASVERAFAQAAHVTRLRLRYPRVSPNTLEPRSAVAWFDAGEGRYTLCSTTQTPWRLKDAVLAALGLDELDLRIVALDVGGGFGMKGQVYPEEVLVTWAARLLSRPVKWTGDRSECLASDMHGRDQLTDAWLALDARGRALALRAEVTINMGCYLGFGAGVSPFNAGACFTGTYDLPFHSVVRGALTNSSPMGPYRGSGKPEASFITERLVDKAARETGMDPVALRRRNLIAPAAMPYRTPGGFVYDCGEFERVLDKGLVLSDWQGFAARRAESEKKGRRRGIGLAMHCQASGSGSERAEVRVTPDGCVALYVGTVAQGQGHETMYAQMMSEWLGVALDRVRVFQGDTDRVLFGRGTYAQRSMIAGGSALKAATDEVIGKGRRFAAWAFEAPEADVEFRRGAFAVKGTDLSMTLAEVARRSYQGVGVPPDLGVGLDGAGSHPGPSSFPNGCMVCEVEVDTDTGGISVERLVAIDDAGTVVNPLTLDGQLHGSLAQGAGEALLEEAVYDPETGQLLTGSFMDYAMPRADDLPGIESEHHVVPTRTNLLGVKGGSEAGNVGGPAAIVNAIVDALAPLGVSDVPLPATPDRVWRLVHGRR